VPLVLVGPIWILSVVAAVAGVWKLLQPTAAASALRTLGVAVPPVAVRALGLGEVLLGTAAIVVGGRLSALGLAVAYAGFAVVADRLRRSPTPVSCGCFGARSAPPGWVHVVVDAVAAAVAALAVITGVDGLAAAGSDLPAGGLAHALASAVGALAIIGLLTVLPEARAAARPPATGHVQLFGPTIPVRGRR
jgi:hypothetical protein